MTRLARGRPSVLSGGLGRSLLIAALGTGLVAVSRLAREMLTARTYGTSRDLDAFLVANLIPLAFLAALGSLSTALVPIFVSQEEDEPSAGRDVLSGVSWVLFLGLLVFAVLIAMSAPMLAHLLAPSFDRSTLDLTTRMIQILSPTVVIAGISATWTAALTARERLVTASAAPAIMPTVAVVGIFLLSDVIGIYALMGGVLMGTILESVVLAVRIRQEGLPVFSRRSPIPATTWLIMRQWAPVVIGTFIMSTSLVVDVSMGSRFGEGSAAILNYASRFPIYVVGFGSLALNAALLPRFSRIVATGGILRKPFIGMIRFVLFSALGLTAVLLLVGESLIRVVFEGGAFTSADAAAAARIQSMYFLQIPFALVMIVCVRAMSAMRSNGLFLGLALVSLVANVTGNIVLSRLLGLAGIALSTSVAYLITMVCALLLVRRLLVSDRATDRKG